MSSTTLVPKKSVEERLIDVLLTKKDGKTLPYRYIPDPNGENIIVESESDEVGERLTGMLRSSDDLVKFLPVNAQSDGDKEKPAKSRVIPQGITGINIFDYMIVENNRTFSFRWETNTQEFFLLDRETIRLDDETSRNKYIAMRKADIEYLKSHMATLSIEDLRDNIASQGKSQPTKETSKSPASKSEAKSNAVTKKPTGTFAALVDQILTVEYDEENHQLVTEFNYGLMWDFLVPPKVTVNELKEDTATRYRVSIPKEHLSRFFSMVNHGVIMEPAERDANGVITKARPILNRAVLEGVARPNCYFIMLDCSGSMDSGAGFAAHKKEMKAYIEELKRRAPNDYIVIRPFSDSVHYFPACSYTLIRDLDIDSYLRNLSADGGTDLYMTMNTLFLEMITVWREGKYNPVFLGFSDGQQDPVDAQALKAKQDLIGTAGQIYRLKAAINAFFIAMGSYGQADDTTKALLRDVVGEIIDTPNSVSLQKLWQRVESVSRPMELVDVITDITNQIIQGKEKLRPERLAVHAGMPIVAQTVVPVPGAFSVNEQHFAVDRNAKQVDQLSRDWVVVPSATSVTIPGTFHAVANQQQLVPAPASQPAAKQQKQRRYSHS